MHAILVLILVYISQALPYNTAHLPLPVVRFIPEPQLAHLLWPHATKQFLTQHRANGVYTWANHTIWLPLGWSADNDEDMAVLVHEMVHHVQVTTHRVFPCQDPDMEEEAYTAQEHWLRSRRGDETRIARDYRSYVKVCHRN